MLPPVEDLEDKLTTTQLQFLHHQSTILMPYSPRRPLRELWIARSREEPPIPEAIAIAIANPVAISNPIAIAIAATSHSQIPTIWSLAISLLSHIHQYQQGRRQPNNDQPLQHALIDIQVQIIIVAVLVVMALIQPAPRRHQIVLLVLAPFVQLSTVIGFLFFVIFNERGDPLLEGAVGLGCCIWGSCQLHRADFPIGSSGEIKTYPLLLGWD